MLYVWIRSLISRADCLGSGGSYWVSGEDYVHYERLPVKNSHK
jgi:hypothetical protein